jgi:hypothetical protein
MVLPGREGPRWWMALPSVIDSATSRSRFGVRPRPLQHGACDVLARTHLLTSGSAGRTRFRDAYTEAVEQIIEAKREHRGPPKLEEPEEKTGQLVGRKRPLPSGQGALRWT